MQNKANVKDAKMNVSSFMTIKYEKLDTWLNWKNKPNTNPIKPKTNPIKANFNAYQTQFKPNPSGLRCLLRSCRTDQSQWIGNELKSPIFPKYLTNVSVDTLAQIWNLRIFHSIISHRNTSLTSDSLMPEITKTDE